MAVQLAGTELKNRTLAVVAEFKDIEGPLLPILHEMQAEFGYVPPESLPVIAEALNLSRAEVHGVVTFYHDYRNHPPGRHVLKLCQAEACQARGAAATTQLAKQMLGVDFHQTARDGSVTLEPVYCLGLCAIGPSAMLDGEVIAGLDRDVLDEIAEEVKR